jgi:hypothetical protein
MSSSNICVSVGDNCKILINPKYGSEMEELRSEWEALNYTSV